MNAIILWYLELMPFDLFLFRNIQYSVKEAAIPGYSRYS